MPSERTRKPARSSKSVLRSLEENLGVDFSCICLYQSEPRRLIVTCVGERSLSVARAIGLDERAPIEPEGGLLATCLHGELFYEAAIEEKSAPFLALLAGGGLRALVCAPLRFESNEVFGVLLVAKRSADSFSSDDREFLRQLSTHVALAAHQARLYDALEASYQDLRQTQQTVMQHERLRALGQIASGIAHDINNALSPASLYAQSLLSHEPGLSERARENLTVIQRAIEDVAQTVQHMRAFYAPRGLERTLSPTALNQVLAQVIDLTRVRWQNMAQERGVVVRVDTDFAPDLPNVLGAESEVRDAMTNLLLNAVDALPDGGVITLRSRHDAREHPRRRRDRRQRRRHDRNRAEPVPGTVLHHQGRRRHRPRPDHGVRHDAAPWRRAGDSAPGRGTLVRLVFPVAPTDAILREAAHAPAAPTPLRILLIDDDPLVLKSLRDALENDQHEVVTAEGGQAGIDEFARALEGGKRFDVVVTDLGMPYVDGRKVATRLRQLDGNVPLIMLTGWGHRLIATDDMPEQVDRVLSKPTKMAELRAGNRRAGAQAS